MAGALLFLESDFLWKLQENNLFLDTMLFFREKMVVPGGLLSWTATYQTQFFYHPWLGTLLLCTWWLLLMWVTKRAFRIPGQWAGLMLIPVGLLLTTIVDMGYWVYMLKLQGHVFVATMATTAVAGLLWAFRKLTPRYGLRILFIAATCALGYPLMGIYGLGAALLMGIWSWRLKGQSRWLQAACSLTALLCAGVVPLLYYRHVYYQTNFANIYYAELPLYYITEEYPLYYTPFYLLALFFVILTIVSPKTMKPWKALLTQGVLLVALTAGIVHSWYSDENFHHELTMQRCIEESDWQGVMKEAALQEDEPTRAIVMMRNLALSRLGRQGEEMYRYKNGSKRYEAPFDMRMMLCVGPLIYYHYGMINYSARLSTEMGVEFGWRVENLKLLAKCAILNKEEGRERKFLNLLKHTTFYDDWVKEARQKEELKWVARMMHYTNFLSGDNGNVEEFLMNRLAESTYKDDAIFQEQTLLASLWTKDTNQFWHHFGDYVSLHPNARIPRYYQEAAYLYAMLENLPIVDQMPIDQSVKQSFDSFMQLAERFDNTEAKYAREGMKAFCHTYYYDYYLMRDLPQY